MGVLVDGTDFPGGVWDQVESKWVSTVSLSIQGTSFHFDRIRLAVEQYRGFVIPWLANQVTSPSSQHGLLSIVSATINDEA
jgi:hypothetical protein